MSKLTAERLRELLHYDPETGVFTWREDRRKQATVGAVAGRIAKKTGYWRIFVCGKYHSAHRLAWLYVHGNWPAGDIDHRDRDRLNNRISNLRCATRSQNLQNTNTSGRNSSGYRGVSWNTNAQKWRANITLAGRLTYLGSYDDPEHAHAAYLRAARQLHTHNPLVEQIDGSAP